MNIKLLIAIGVIGLFGGCTEQVDRKPELEAVAITNSVSVSTNKVQPKPEDDPFARIIKKAVIKEAFSFDLY